MSAGLVDIEFVNNSSAGIAVNFSLMVEGATIDDVIATAPESGDLGDYHDLPSLAEPGQITRPVEPGATVTFGVALTTPGDYAVSCAMTEPTINTGVPTIASIALSVGF